MLFFMLFDTKTCFGDPPFFRLALDCVTLCLSVSRIEFLADDFGLIELCFGVAILFITLALGLADDCDHRDSHDELEEAREVRTAGDAATAHTTNGEDDTPDHRARGQIAPAEASVVFLINANHLKNKL